MSHSNIKVDNRVTTLSFIGPTSVIVTVLLLIFKESPFYIDLSVTALVGLALSTRLQLKGFGIASALLMLVLAYGFLFNGVPLTFWEIGLGLSLELTFAITALATVELSAVLNEAYAAAKDGALLEVEEWKEKISHALTSKDALSLEIDTLQKQLPSLQDALKAQTERSEMFERMLSLARDEINVVNAERSRIETQSLEYKNESKQWRELNFKLENELQQAHLSVLDKEKLSQQHSLNAMDSELKLEHQKSLTSDSEGKIHALGEQLEDLIDRLKNLQTENDDLAKALEEALKPVSEVKESKELSRVRGLHNQLRSQFNEKSKTLDETRCTLFSTQEAYLSLQKNADDEIHFDQESVLKDFENYILSLSKIIEGLEAEIEVLNRFGERND